jgi:hypothetical protein
MLRRALTTDLRQVRHSIDAVTEDDGWVRLCAEALAAIEHPN